MNEEEKKALKVINTRTKRLLDEFKIEKEDMSDETKIAYLMQEIRANKTILNLIEKLQKENEELKLYNNSITSQLEQMTTEKFKEGWIHKSEFKDFIPVQKVKDKIKEILKNGEYRIIFKGDAEFPDEATIITAQKYLKLEKVQKLQQENERLRKQSKIMCDEYCPYAEKIKAKIEELDIAILECEYSDDDSEEYKKEVEKDKVELLKQKRVLQELLEGRK